MRVCAVICEYNPFHLGHAYHLRAAREASGADYVLCLMSGALTQRGAFARRLRFEELEAGALEALPLRTHELPDQRCRLSLAVPDRTLHKSHIHISYSP